MFIKVIGNLALWLILPGMITWASLAIFLDYMRYINRLKDRPEWYNALTGNCTPQIRGHARPYTGKANWDWRILLNGWLDEMAYENGLLNQTLDFQTLKEKSIINKRAKTMDQSPDFSVRIRQGLPGMGD